MKISVFMILSMFLYASVYGQDSRSDLLNALQAKYNSANTIFVNFIKYSGSKEDFSGKLLLKKDNKLRIELKNNTIITDGKTFWNYNKNEKKVIINNYDPSEPSELSLNTFINDYPSKSNVTSGEEGNYKTLTLEPKTSGLNFNSAKLFINKENLVDKVIIDSNSGTAVITFTGYKLDRDLPDSEFTYSPPEGTKVIDLR